MIAFARMPKDPEFIITAVNKMDTKNFSPDALQTLLNYWPEKDEAKELVEEARKDPSVKWEKAESFYIELCNTDLNPGFYERLVLWKYYMGYDKGFKVL